MEYKSRFLAVGFKSRVYPSILPRLCARKENKSIEDLDVDTVDQNFTAL